MGWPSCFQVVVSILCVTAYVVKKKTVSTQYRTVTLKWQEVKCLSNRYNGTSSINLSYKTNTLMQETSVEYLGRAVVVVTLVAPNLTFQ
jgi:hypothetical protein